MPSLHNINKRDETASKIPAPAHGVGALAGAGGGYASVVCLPVTIIFGAVYSVVKAVQRKRRRKAENRASAEGVGEQPQSEQKSPQLGREERERRKEGNPSPPARDDMVERLEKHHDNPRVCDPECPGYGQDKCAVHHRDEKQRPASPGLLAV
ncbi:hypothetical protein C8034_v001127 [Colletotrichum sidae]|uniref:Uncharacterized protein n=1 Tax=Colletotrichum sidae TaxID=1347389 RepID=A0A4R8TG85_9PEZI|nr:hypothetical protein C8034_v001127 [Colletotrichum sidae]